MHDSAEPITDGRDSGAVVKPLSLDVKRAAIALGCSERLAWTLIANGQLPSFKFGRVRRVRVTDIEAYLDRLVKEEDEARGRAKTPA